VRLEGVIEASRFISGVLGKMPTSRYYQAAMSAG
jgi:hypothetical protein